jgi:predicted lipoprotein
LPAHEGFVASLAGLETAVESFTADPNLESLTAVQEAWSAANQSRMATLPFRIGPVDDSLLHSRLDKRPPRTIFVDETLIAGTEPITNDYLASVGSTSVGLSVMEYLIFDPVAGNTAVLTAFTTAEHADRRGQLLLILAQNVHQRAIDLSKVWTAEGDDYARAFVEADMDGGELQGSMNMLINQIVADVEEIISSRLGKPAGKRTGGAIRPDLAEAIYSQSSLARIIATVEAEQAAFNGGSGLGLDDYLDYLGAAYEDEPLSAVIKAQFETSLEALRAIDGPLETAVENDLPQVDIAIEELRTLLVLLKVDVPNHLGVTLTFNDNDGD